MLFRSWELSVAGVEVVRPLAVWLTAKEAARRRRRFPSYEVWAWAAYLVGAVG